MLELYLTWIVVLVTLHKQKHRIIRRMNEIEKLDAEDDSSFGRLPEDVVLQILNKLINLKTLCVCKLVSKRFNLIVSQVDVISLTSSADSFASPSSLGWSAIWSLLLFRRVKSIRIQVPSSFDSHDLFKWKVNFKISPDSILVLSPNLVYHKKELDVNENNHQEEEEIEDEEEDMEVTIKTFDMLKECLKDVLMRIELLFHVIRLPLLKMVSIMDSSKRGKISLSGAKVAEFKSWLFSYETMKQKLYYLPTDCRISECYVPFLELPVSRYVMKGVYLYLLEWSDHLPDDQYDRFTKIDDDFEDKDEAAYSEAMVEIFKNHRGRIKRME
ncbi:F-box domain containing protein [Tanacetum coccineum]|uniref:F-box domain containing protein n=1 Tax=Tanacetum coccineum TaxID=301880 RepID=A0ABQ5B9U6_9ASTR